MVEPQMLTLDGGPAACSRADPSHTTTPTAKAAIAMIRSVRYKCRPGENCMCLNLNRRQILSRSNAYTDSPDHRRAIRWSSEKRPGPKIRITNDAMRYVKGAAAENLSGSEKMESKASRSPVIYATVMFPVNSRAMKRLPNPSASKRPPANSRIDTKYAVGPGIGSPRLPKYSMTFGKLCSLPQPSTANCHPQYNRTNSRKNDCRELALLTRTEYAHCNLSARFGMEVFLVCFAEPAQR